MMAGHIAFTLLTSLSLLLSSRAAPVPCAVIDSRSVLAKRSPAFALRTRAMRTGGGGRDPLGVRKGGGGAGGIHKSGGTANRNAASHHPPPGHLSPGHSSESVAGHSTGHAGHPPGTAQHGHYAHAGGSYGAHAQHAEPQQQQQRMTDMGSMKYILTSSIISSGVQLAVNKYERNDMRKEDEKAAAKQAMQEAQAMQRRSLGPKPAAQHPAVANVATHHGGGIIHTVGNFVKKILHGRPGHTSSDLGSTRNAVKYSLVSSSVVLAASRIDRSITKVQDEKDAKKKEEKEKEKEKEKGALSPNPARRSLNDVNGNHISLD